MRLIDADALSLDGTIADIVEGIISAPTLGPKRGGWCVIGMRPVGTKLTHYCSACGRHGNNDMKFCSNCGCCMSGADVGTDVGTEGNA